MTPKAFTVNYNKQLLDDVTYLRESNIEVTPLIRRLVHDYVTVQREKQALYDQLDRSVGHDSYEV